MTLTIRRKLFGMAAAAAIVVVALAGLQMWSAGQHEATLQMIFEREFRPLVGLQAIDVLLKEMRFRMAGVLLDQMPIPGSRNQLKEVREQVPMGWKAYRAAAGDGSGDQRAIVAAIEAGLPALEAFAGQLDAAYAAGDKTKITALLEDDWPVVHGKVLKPLSQLLPLANQAVKDRYEQARADGRRQRVLLAIVAVSGLVVLGVGTGRVAQGLHRAIRDLRTGMQRLAEGDLSAEVAVHSRDELGEVARSLNTVVATIRDVMTQVQGAADHANEASQQLAGAADHLASGAQQQASSLEQTAASLEEISGTVKQNADNMKQANQLAQGSRDAADKGGSVVTTAVHAMSEINQASKKIADIITTIDEIAFQTNLLALNAAVEAARAGEQGRGFAVVAAEVRNLAQRSANAAKEIKALIQDSVAKVETGAALVDQSGHTLGEIVTSVKRVTDIIAEIAAASQEQTTGIDQVNRAVTQMDHVTQANAEQTEALSSTAHALATQAERLQGLVAQFKLGDQHVTAGDTESPAAAPAPRARKVSHGVASGHHAVAPVRVATGARHAGGGGFEEF